VGRQSKEIFMNMKFIFCLLALLPSALVALSPAEEQDLQRRLDLFRDGSRDVMSEPLPRYDLATDKLYVPTEGTPKPPEWRRPPKAKVRPTWAGHSPQDDVKNLTESWVKANEVVFYMDWVPVVGTTKLDLWSAYYWPHRQGGLSYRYAQFAPFTSYDKAVASYSQPAEWLTVLSHGLDYAYSQSRRWSPAEKWDITVGDESFSLTRQQKELGHGFRDEKGKVASWMGICDGWAAASVMVPRPQSPVNVRAARGSVVTWYPDEIRAMATLNWAKGEYAFNSVGGRCRTDKAETYPNGRLKQEECFDTNPATFLLSLANLIGKAGSSVIMDISFDKEVWNQPIRSYEVTYFNPLDSRYRSRRWKDVAVPYDARFKARDRFQQPLTRGLSKEGRYEDKGISAIVGGIVTVTYLAEVAPANAPVSSQDIERRVSFVFDLELYEAHGHTYAWGGEWHQNAHPDFLWIPQKGTRPKHTADVRLSYDLTALPSSELAKAGAGGSVQGYPLCAVLNPLVESSSRKKYGCP